MRLSCCWYIYQCEDQKKLITTKQNAMKKILLSLLTVALALGFTACTKPVIEPVEDLPVSATLIRHVDYTVRGTSRDTTYSTGGDKIITGAGYGFKSVQDKDANTFYVSIDAGPHIANTYGENVVFVIDKAKLKPGFVGVYSADQQAATPLYDATYAYSYKSENGSSANLHNLRMGLQMVGELKIEGYDALRKAISGSYRLFMRLDTDPLKFTRIMEPEDKCELTVSGTFLNVKIKQN